MRWFASNVRTFLLALILGVAVWVSAVSAADPDEERLYPRPIPIEIVGQGSGLVLTSEIPTDMNVRLRAPRSVWDKLNSQDDAVRAILDLSGMDAGEHKVNIQVQVSRRPAQIVLANPSSVTVNLESFSNKSLPLALSLTGQPSPGYQAGEATVNTKEVMISGPQSLVNEAMRARATVNLDGVRENIKDEAVPVQVINAKNEIIKGLTISPETVKVNVPVSLQGGYRDLAVKVIVNGQQAPGYRLENVSVYPPVITVFSTNSGLVSSLPGMVETQPLDLQDAKDDISTRLTLNLPDGVTLIGPQTVQVQVSITPMQNSIRLSNLPIKVTGVAEGLTATTLPKNMDVIISGPVPVLETMSAQDVVVSVDVSGKGIGSYQLEPQISPSNSNVLVESKLPATVEVVLSLPGTPTPTPFPTTPFPTQKP